MERSGPALAKTKLQGDAVRQACIGHYEDEVDGNFIGPTQLALDVFEDSDIDAVFQAVRAKEKYDPSLGPREALHIGSAAIAGVD